MRNNNFLKKISASITAFSLSLSGVFSNSALLTIKAQEENNNSSPEISSDAFTYELDNSEKTFRFALAPSHSIYISSILANTGFLSYDDSINFLDTASDIYTSNPDILSVEGSGSNAQLVANEDFDDSLYLFINANQETYTFTIVNSNSELVVSPYSNDDNITYTGNVSIVSTDTTDFNNDSYVNADISYDESLVNFIIDNTPEYGTFIPFNISTTANKDSYDVSLMLPYAVRGDYYTLYNVSGETPLEIEDISIYQSQKDARFITGIFFTAEELGDFVLVASKEFDCEIEEREYDYEIQNNDPISLKEIIQNTGVYTGDFENAFIDNIQHISLNKSELVTITETEDFDYTLTPQRLFDTAVLNLIMNNGEQANIIISDGRVKNTETSLSALEQDSTISAIIVRPAEGEYFPADAEVYAETTNDEAALNTVQGNINIGEFTDYKVFNVGINNIDISNYSEFNVELQLNSNSNIKGKDFRLYHIGNSETVDELNVIPDTYEDENGNIITKGFFFTTFAFSNFVLVYNTEIDGNEYSIDLTESEIYLDNLLSELSVPVSSSEIAEVISSSSALTAIKDETNDWKISCVDTFEDETLTLNLIEGGSIVINVHYNIVEPTKYEITWKNDDEILGTDFVAEGEIPVYSGETPTRPAEETQYYLFSGWSPAITPATENTTYNAAFDVYEKRILTITASSKSKVYDTRPLVDNTYTVSGLIGTDTVESVVVTGTQTDVGTSENIPSDAVVVDEDGNDVSSHYIMDYVNGSLTITPAPVSVVAKAASKTYGDEDPLFSATVSGLLKEEDVIEYSITRETGDNVGSYFITPTGAETQGNYAITYESNLFTINKRHVDITIKGNRSDITYDGEEHTSSGYETIFSDNLYLVEYLKFEGTATATRTFVGTTRMGLTENNFQNENDNFDAEITVSDGFQRINPATGIVVTITGKTNETNYDGLPHRVEGYDVSINNPLYTVDDFTFSGVDEAETIDAGTVYMGLTVDSFMNDNSNFEDVEFVVTDGYQTVLPITTEVLITGESQTFDYNGEEQVVTGYTAVADSLYYDVNSDIVFSGNDTVSRTDAGTTQMGLLAEQFSNINPNFSSVTFIVEDGSITIEPISATVEIIGHTNETDYDGQEHTISGYDVVIDSSSIYTADDFVFNGTASATATNAGTVNMGLSATQFENINPNFTQINFEITDGYQVINPITANVTIVGHNATISYDGELHIVEGYDVSVSTPLYNADSFVLHGTAEASQIDAGEVYMGLTQELFENINPNFTDVVFDVTDGWLIINPQITITKQFDNLIATEPEDFKFDITLTDDFGNPIADYTIAEDITTNEEGKASFLINVAPQSSQSKNIIVPLDSSIEISEDKTYGDNNYLTFVKINDEISDVSSWELLQVSESQTEITFINRKSPICRIGEEEFQTISSAIDYAVENGGEAIIEMLMDYNMPTTDVVVIPRSTNITIVTASDFDGSDGVTITRSSNFTGPLFTNDGTLSFGEAENPLSKINLNGADIPSTDALINNNGTLNLYDGVNISRANNTSGNGGAVFADSGTVNITGSTISNNKAVNGGAIYSNNANLNIASALMQSNNANNNGGAIYSNTGVIELNSVDASNNHALAGSGGFAYSNAGAINMTDGIIANNEASIAGGALSSESGTITLTSGRIIGNKASIGAALYEKTNAINFINIEITSNIATGETGAVAVGSDSAKLNFMESPIVSGNNALDGTPCNVYLNFDTDLIINALGLSETANIGIYVPGDGDLYEHRGVSRARFGSYTTTENINAFKNDRTEGMSVNSDNFKMVWGKSLRVEVRELNPMSATAFPPTARGTVKYTKDYYPKTNDNHISDLAADVMTTLKGITAGYSFAVAFAKEATTYAENLTMVKWDNSTSNWGFVNRDGDFVESASKTLVIYYSYPAYISIVNNTASPLDLRTLIVNNISVNDNTFGLVIARNGITTEYFDYVTPDDLILETGTSIKLMFPGVRGLVYQMNGVFVNSTETTIPYSRTNDLNTTITTTAVEDGRAFNMTGNFLSNTNTIEIVFGSSKSICKIVEVKPDSSIIEHLYPSLQSAVADASENYDDYVVTVIDPYNNNTSYQTVKIEMLVDYTIPSTDKPDIPDGKSFTFTTAAEGKTRGAHKYNGEGDQAQISRDQGNNNSFIQSTTGSNDGTSITQLIVENLIFDGKQLGEGNGGVINTLNTDVIVRNVKFINFQANNGGAIFVQVDAVPDPPIPGPEEEPIPPTPDPRDEGVGYNSLAVYDCEFDNCISKARDDRWGGGAIWTNVENLSINGSKFTKCNATQQGGAVFHRIDQLYRYRLTSTTTVANCTFEHCYANAAGGLEIDAYTVDVTDCHFDDCQALTRNGGAFNAYLQNTTEHGTLTVDGSSFNNCFANLAGGGFRTQFSTTVSNSTFTNNTANTNGGGICIDRDDTLTLENVVITGNKAAKVGGGVYSVGNLVIFNHSNISSNTLTNNNPANAAGIFLSDSKTLTLGPENNAYTDTIRISDNFTVDGQPSNLKLPEKSDTASPTGKSNKDSVVIVRSNFSTGDNNDQKIHVLNANKKATRFGTTSGVNFPTGFSDLTKIFESDINELYGVVDKTNGSDIYWKGTPIVKITTSDDKLLFFDQNCLEPLVFDTLDLGAEAPNKTSAFGLLRYSRNELDDLYYKDGNTNKKYNQGNRTYKIKMLVEETIVDKYITTTKNNDSWETIIFTTAGQYDTDGFPFEQGKKSGTAKITANGRITNLLTVKINMTLENITLDAGALNATPNATRVISADPGSNSTSLLTLKNNTTLQNANFNGNGGGVLLNWGMSMIMEEGATIKNCTANNGGGLYKDGGNGQFILNGGSITNCHANLNGGGIFYVKANAGKDLTINSGTISNCTAVNNGGGIYVNSNSNNASADILTINGGQIINNHAEEIYESSSPTAGVGGGIGFANKPNSRVYISGDAVIYNNTKGTDNAPCNIELARNTEKIINAKGLGENALIGIYVRDKSIDDKEEVYDNRGVKDKVFASWSVNSNYFELFINDRNSLRGAKHPTQSGKIWWQEMQTLEISKSVESPLSADRNRQFTFEVQLEDTSVNGKYGSGNKAITFTNGYATFTLTDGQMKSAIYLPTENVSGGYTITETVDNYFETTVNGEPGNVIQGAFGDLDDEGHTILLHEANFVNTRKNTNLSISKTVVSEDSDDNDKNFNFRVLINEPISGTYGDMTFENSIATFTLKHGETCTAEDLPTGIHYTVIESEERDFDTTYKINGEIVSEVSSVFLELEGNNVEAVNSRRVGGLTVSKAVISDAAADKNFDFNFTIMLSDRTINKHYGDEETGMTFVDGVAHISLKHGQSKTAQGLPQGITYTVAETNSAGFSVRSNNRTGRINDSIIVADFTNTRSSGRLAVQKTVNSQRYLDRTEPFLFDIALGNTIDGEFVIDTSINRTYGTTAFTNGVGSFQINGNGTRTFSGIPQGIEYQITEREKPNFVLTSSENASGTISANLITASFTNTRETGNIEIQKVVNSEIPLDHTTAGFNFTLKLDDTHISGVFGDMTFTGGVANFTLKDGETIIAEDLPTDVGYTVSESAGTYFSVETENAQGTIAKDTPTVIFTNTRRRGSLEIYKIVKSDLVADHSKDFTFNIELSGIQGTQTYGEPGYQVEFVDGVGHITLKDNQGFRLTGLPAGITYTVSEPNDENFTILSSGATGTITVNGAKTTFTNTRKTGRVTIRKQVTSDLYGDTTGRYYFNVKLGTITDDGFVVDTSITQKYSNIQFVEGVAVNVPVTGGRTFTFSTLPQGYDYLIEEVANEGFTTTSTNETGTISSTAPATATFHNTRKTADLVVKKKVVSDLTADANVSFDFRITLNDRRITKKYDTENKDGTITPAGIQFNNGVATFSLKDGEILKIKNLPVTVTYSITETANQHFITTRTGAAASLPLEGAESVFTNTRRTGDLAVSKRVDSDLASDKDVYFNFTITLSDRNIGKVTEERPNGKLFGDIVFKDGVATFSLKSGETLIAKDLPTTVSYTIVEEENTNFITTKTGDTGTISTIRSTSIFTNKRRQGTLQVSKQVISEFSEDFDTEFNFTVTLSDKTIGDVSEYPSGKAFGGMVFKNGVAHFSLKSGQTIRASELPLDVNYTVTEESVQGFVPVDPYNGVISGGVESAVFRNYRAVSKITSETGQLLYYRNNAGIVKPAVYNSLPSAFAVFQPTEFSTTPLLFTTSEGTDIYHGNYNVEMLVYNSTVTEGVTAPVSRTINITTASPTAQDGFSYYKGSSALDTAVIRRGYNGTSLITTKGTLTLGNITIDGNINNFSSTTEGGLVYVDESSTFEMSTGATLQNSISSANGGAVYVKENGTFNMKGGTIAGNRVTADKVGPGVYLAEGSRMNIQGNALFSGNTVNTTIENKTNGGLVYTIPRQDIYIAGYEGTDASSLYVSGEISSPVESIWVWAEKPDHYEVSNQFAKLTDEFLNLMSGNPVALERTLRAFRNALDDTTNKNAARETVIGVSGEIPGLVYWSGVAGTQIVLLRKTDNTIGSPKPLAGAKFAVYSSPEGGTPITLKKDGISTVLENLTSRDDGVFFYGELPLGTYYVFETQAPEGYGAPTTRFRVDVTEDMVMVQSIS